MLGLLAEGRQLTIAEALTEMAAKLPSKWQSEYEDLRTKLTPEALLEWTEHRLMMFEDDPHAEIHHDDGQGPLTERMAEVVEDANDIWNMGNIPGDTARPSETELSLWTVAWGPEHLGLVRDWLFPSLAQPENLPALVGEHGYKKVYLDLYIGSTAEDRDSAEQAADQLVRQVNGPSPSGPSLIQVNIDSSLAAGGLRTLAVRALRESVKRSIERNTRLLVAPPDEFWGNGSLSNLCLYARGRNFSVATSHLRVTPDIEPDLMASIRHFTLSNAQLVTLAFQYLAPGTAQQFDELDPNATWTGGMSIRKIRYGLWTLVNHVPSPRLVYLQEDDMRYFKRFNTVGFWDHALPARLVPHNLRVQRGDPTSRLRIIADSDLFFTVERTIPGQNIERTTAGMCGNDLYHVRRPHNELCQSLVTVLRGV